MTDDDRQREQLEQLMEDLGHAVVRAMSSSDDVARAMRRIRKQGVSMSLLLDCQVDEDGNAEDGSAKESGAKDGASKDGASKDRGAKDRGAKVQIEAPSRPEAIPQFRLDTTDVSWLRSLGIDATRRGRARKRGRTGIGTENSGDNGTQPDDSSSAPDAEPGHAPSHGD